MKIVFDPGKDALNRVKHGVGLVLANLVFAGRHVSMSDDRFDYGEARRIAIGRIEGRMFVCVYVDLGEERRVISLRKANAREVRRFEQDLQ